MKFDEGKRIIKLFMESKLTNHDAIKMFLQKRILYKEQKT